ncbi:hypothetical protein AOLI_G00280800 [Acnodon oligacanthus]
MSYRHVGLLDTQNRLSGFAGEIISAGGVNIKENDSYMFNLDNKVGEVCGVGAQFYSDKSHIGLGRSSDWTMEISSGRSRGSISDVCVVQALEGCLGLQPCEQLSANAHCPVLSPGSQH